MEPQRQNENLETIRTRCFDRAANSFAQNLVDLDRYDELAGQIASANDATALQRIEQELPEPVAEIVPEVQVIEADRSSVRKEGKWVQSPRVLVRAVGSNVRLDLRSHMIESDQRMHLNLDADASNIRIIVPRDIDVIEQLESNRMSVFRAGRGDLATRGAIIITGTIARSNVRVRRRRVRRRKDDAHRRSLPY